MEKNLVEHSNSFAHETQDDVPGDTSHSSKLNTDENNNNNNVVVDDDNNNNNNIVVDDNNDKPSSTNETENVVADSVVDSVADSDHVKGEEEQAKEEEKEEEKKETEEETVVASPKTPPPSFEKISEDIDQFIMTLQNSIKNANENKEATTPFEIPSYLLKFLDHMDQKITKYETGGVKWMENEEEDSSFLESANRISMLMNHFTEYYQCHQPKEDAEDKDKIKGNMDFMMNGIGSIHQRAMSVLEEEFHTLMEESTKNLINKPEQKGKQHEASETEQAAEDVIAFPGFTEETVTTLKKIVKEMIAGGYENECCHYYSLSRRSAFEDCMPKLLGYEKLSIDEVQKMQWESLEREIPAWINMWKEVTTLWFIAERKLTLSVFEDDAEICGNLYGNLSHGIMIQLLNFAESIAMTKRAGEKLFKLLDMYETLRDLIPSTENLFPDDIMGDIKSEATSAKCRLGESAVMIFCDLENSIKSETGKTPVAGGAVHPLTRYIMNYLRLACEYKDTLEEVFKEHSKIERADSTSRPRYESENSKPKNRLENVSPFAAQLMRVMELLDSNLEGKAKLYKEVALSCIFMMNNGRYIVQKIKGSPEIYEVMGETWCRKRSTELRTYHKNYQVETWSKILSYLSPKGLNENGKVHKPVLKERFKSFNAAFEEIHRTQSTWVVSDEQLQSELRVSISALVIPAYRSFLGRFSQYLDPGRQTEKYIKYQAEDVETYIDELFDGNPHGRR